VKGLDVSRASQLGDRSQEKHRKMQDNDDKYAKASHAGRVQNIDR